MLCLNVALGQLIFIFILIHVLGLSIIEMVACILLDIILRVGGCGVGGVAEV